MLWQILTFVLVLTGKYLAAFAGLVVVVWLGAAVLTMWWARKEAAASAQDPEARLKNARALRERFEKMGPLHIIGEDAGSEHHPPMDFGDPCVICCEPKVDGEQCRILHCKHSYHVDCIDMWWLTSKERAGECPLCKQRTAETTMIGVRMRGG